MKAFPILVLLASSLSLPAMAANAASAEYLAESRKTAQEFMQTLGTILKQTLEAEGTDLAITVCKQIAPAQAAGYSQNGRVLRRVSLKPRNQALGTPDAWETRMLERAEQSLHNGEAVAGMEYSEVRDEPDGRWFRYLKVIPTQHLCLQCHGQPDQIPDNVKARLAAEYPDDQATGYSVGSIRGGVSIKQKLE